MFAHFGRLLTVLLKFSTMRPDQMLARVEFEGEDRVKAAHALGKGALLFTGHFGYWEINALVHALVLQPMALLARPLDNPLLHDLLERVRGRTGNSVIYRRGAVRRILRALGGNQAIAVLIDQHIQTADAVYVDFFNRPAATTSARRRAGAADRRAGDSGVRAAAAGRPVPHGLRARRRSAAAPTIRTRSAISRSAAPTCSRCTCAAIPACGCGCTAAGATSSRRHAGATAGMFPAATTERRDGDRERDARAASPSVGQVQRLLVRAPNWLGDAVMALPALAAVRRAFEGRTIDRRGDSRRSRRSSRSSTAAAPDEVLVDRSRARSRRSCRRRRPTRSCCCPTRSAAPGGRAAAARPSAGATARAAAAGCSRAACAGRAARVHQVEYYLELVRGLGLPAPAEARGDAARGRRDRSAGPRRSPGPTPCWPAAGVAAGADHRRIRAGRRLRPREALAAGSRRAGHRRAVARRGVACVHRRGAARTATRGVR